MADNLGRRLLLLVHFGLLVLGYGLLGFGYFYPLRFSVVVLAVWAIRVVAALAFVTGLALMAMREGKSESIILAVCTVAAFGLLVLVCL